MQLSFSPSPVGRFAASSLAFILSFSTLFSFFNVFFIFSFFFYSGRHRNLFFFLASIASRFPLQTHVSKINVLARLGGCGVHLWALFSFSLFFFLVFFFHCSFFLFLFFCFFQILKFLFFFLCFPFCVANAQNLIFVASIASRFSRHVKNQFFGPSRWAPPLGPLFLSFSFCFVHPFFLFFFLLFSFSCFFSGFFIVLFFQ